MRSKSVQQECLAKSVQQVSSKTVLSGVLCRSVKQERPAKVSSKSVKKECPARVSTKSVLSRVSDKSVRQECLTRVSSMILSRYSTKMSRKSVQQVCPIRVFRKRFLSRDKKSVKQECPTRLSHKSVLQGCPIQEFSNMGAFGFVGSISFFYKMQARPNQEEQNPKQIKTEYIYI